MSEPSKEYVQVEHPFVKQLQALGWDYLEGDTDVPYLTERSPSDAFWERVERIIPDHGDRQQWLKEHRGMHDL